MAVMGNALAPLRAGRTRTQCGAGTQFAAKTLPPRRGPRASPRSDPV